MKRVAAIITNYNMPERADALAEAVLASKWPVDLYLVDNGSDIVPEAKHTNIRLGKNRQTTGGWLAGLNHVRYHGDYFAYAFLITSAAPTGDDFIASCAGILDMDDNAAGAHPALTQDSTTAWEHMKARGGPSRRTWMIDNICSMWRADFFDAHPFDPALKYGWGIDLELCWHARNEGRSIWIAEGAQVRKISDIGYTMDRMNMGASERQRLATENMETVLSGRYGPGWYSKLTKEGIDDNLR